MGQFCGGTARTQFNAEEDEGTSALRRRRRRRPPATSLADTEVAKLTATFGITTLAARNKVINTEITRNTFAHPGWGAEDMNWGSFKQRSRHMEKKGRRQPLNVWATRITIVRSTENQLCFTLS